YPGIIGQALAGNFQFSQRAVIIEVSSIKILRAREVCFACIRAEAKCRFDSRFRQRQARRSMVMAEDVEEVMSPGELTVPLEKRWVSRDSLVQQISRLQQLLLPTNATARRQKKIFGASVEIEAGEIGGWWSLDREFFSECDLCVKLLSDLLRDLALDCGYVVQITSVFLYTNVCVG